MRKVIWILFVLAFLVLNICLLVPMGSRAMSWEEAALGIIPSALVAFICFLLLVAGVGAKNGSPSRATRLWAAALLWSVLIGGIVTFVTSSSYQSNMSSAREERTSSSSRSSSSSLEEAYARHDQVGILFGMVTLGFAGLSLLGLIISLVMKKRVPDNA